jgi:hypothetical protein
MRTQFWLGSLKRADHSADLGIDERTRLKRVLRKQDGKYVDRIHLAEDNGRCRALVNTVIKMRVL